MAYGINEKNIIINEAIKGWGVSIAGRDCIVHVYKEKDLSLLVKCLKFWKLPGGETGYYSRHCLKQLLSPSEYQSLGSDKSKQRFLNQPYDKKRRA